MLIHKAFQRPYGITLEPTGDVYHWVWGAIARLAMGDASSFGLMAV